MKPIILKPEISPEELQLYLDAPTNWQQPGSLQRFIAGCLAVLEGWNEADILELSFTELDIFWPALGKALHARYRPMLPSSSYTPAASA